MSFIIRRVWAVTPFMNLDLAYLSSEQTLLLSVQVNSEFQAFKHIDIRSRGEMARAMKSLEATLALQPTLILTNSLPCSLDVIVWQAGPPWHALPWRRNLID